MKNIPVENHGKKLLIEKNQCFHVSDNMEISDKKVFEKIKKYHKKLSNKFNDIPSHDLYLIIRNLIKPKNWPKRFLLRKIGKNKYVP